MSGSKKRCRACEGGVAPLSQEAISLALQSLDGWSYCNDSQCLIRRFTFTDFYQTMAFINALAWVANENNHHPDGQFGYNYCELHFKTHAVGAVTENDIICAEQVNDLFYDE